MANFTPAVNSFSRVFLIEGGARPDHAPAYKSCMAVGAVSRSYGDITRIECPDPQNYGKFIEIGTIRGSTERATTSLMGRYASDLRSDLVRLAEKGCKVDIHVHFGACKDPSNFTKFDKAVVLPDADITTLNLGELGTLGSDGQASVDESVDISAEDIVEILPISYASRATDVLDVEIVDMIVFDTASCGDCDVESDGCQKIFGISLTGGLGSPLATADCVYSIDGGTTWYANDIDSAGASNSPDAIAGIGNYLVVVSNADGAIHYADITDFDGTTTPDWTQVTTGVVVGGEPNDIWSVGTKAFVVGDGGYIYSTTDPTIGLTVLDAGVATSVNLEAVHAINSEFAVAVGASGVVVKTENGVTWTAVTAITSTPSLNCVWVVSERVFWVGTATGKLYYTLDGGTTWTEKAFTGSGAGAVHDIAFAGDVGFMSHATATPAGRILRSYDGGYQWVITPESGTLPANDRISALALCGDANIVFAGGLADDGTDGIIFVGSD